MEKVGYDTLIGVAGAVVDGPASAPKWVRVEHPAKPTAVIP